MIELNWTSLSLGLALSFFLLFFFFVCAFYKKCVFSPLWQKKKVNFWLVLLAVLLVIVVSIDTDWFSYQRLVWNYDFTEGAYNHGEPIYAYIVRLINKNYLLFRIIVWGGALLLSCLTFRRLNLNINVALYFLIAMYLIRFNYARASLAMACYFMGLSFLVKPLGKEKLLNFLLVVLFFYGAYAFHHSTIVLAMLTIVFFLPLEKPYVWLLLLIIIPFMSMLSNVYFSLADSMDNDYLLSKYSGYLNEVSSKNNIFGIIGDIISYAAFLVPLLIIAKSVVKHRACLTISIVRFFRITMAIVLFASTFLFMGLESMVLFYRYLFMTMIPLTILSVWLYSRNLMSRKAFSLIVLCGVFSNLFKLIYAVYLYW